ncbi:hypothetical protein [Acetonema longum]|uniref:Uncharacterized protein n=1 Tax=Acetonema longum DSM 6540 TaxID=1009370 RepID=F7NK40_9FIRM|nr:hypothetical protein [Acetonema longum]EGO63481.1 hypothetical protein ALO_12266 [Acetonema longum DSM 6540]
MAFSVIHLGDMIDELGEDECKKHLAVFSCSLDGDIEFFLKEKAILFQVMGVSRTYLVYASYKDSPILVGYFSLASKGLSVRKNVSGSLRKKITGSKSKEISAIPVFLIGQISKNYANDMDKLQLISGSDLLRLALIKIKEAQHITGGRIVLIECIGHNKLKEFYDKHGFVFLDQDGNDGLLRYIREINHIDIT